MDVPVFLHFFSAVLAIGLSSIGTAIGQGIAGFGAAQAINRQSLGINRSFRALIIGLALSESGVILALVVALMTLFVGSDVLTLGIGIADLGVGFAIGSAAGVVGFASSFAVKAACVSISREPFFSQKIVTLMLLVQSMIEAPVIFTFIIILLIRMQITPDLSLYNGIKLSAAGIVMGLGCIGPSIGQAFFAHSSCLSVGINRKAYTKIFTFSLLSQAIIETPVIFCLLLAVLYIYRPIQSIKQWYSVYLLYASAVTIGLASIGTGIGTGYVASRSCYRIALANKYGIVFRTTLLAQVFIESSAIYALIVALLLVMRVG